MAGTVKSVVDTQVDVAALDRSSSGNVFEPAEAAIIAAEKATVCCARLAATALVG